MACLSKFANYISMQNQKKHMVFYKSNRWVVFFFGGGGGGEVLAMLCKVLSKLNFFVKHVYRNVFVFKQCKHLLQIYVNLKATPQEI